MNTRSTSVSLADGRTMNDEIDGLYVRPGDHFTLTLADGRKLHVEQTADDFSMTFDDDVVALSIATSDHAKSEDVEMSHVSGQF